MNKKTIVLNPYNGQGVELEAFESVTATMAQGLVHSQTGYGSKIPTSYKVKYNGRIYRIYSTCFSNTSTEYILINGKKISFILNINSKRGLTYKVSPCIINISAKSSAINQGQ